MTCPIYYMIHDMVRIEYNNTHLVIAHTRSRDIVLYPIINIRKSTYYVVNNSMRPIL